MDNWILMTAMLHEPTIQDGFSNPLICHIYSTGIDRPMASTDTSQPPMVFVIKFSKYERVIFLMQPKL